jgi:hypothetical protein
LGKHGLRGFKPGREMFQIDLSDIKPKGAFLLWVGKGFKGCFLFIRDHCMNLIKIEGSGNNLKINNFLLQKGRPKMKKWNYY